MARLKAIAGPITPENWGKAIGAYERTLVSRSRFDEFLGGKLDALSPAERQGLRTFITTGCVACHNGVGVGGGEFKKFGVVEDYWKLTGSQRSTRGSSPSSSICAAPAPCP
jgi:cytochrome c peroxidase